MRLKEIEFEEFVGTKKEWRLPRLELGAVNLVAGPNAVGKSRTLTIINSLAELLMGNLEISNSHWQTLFIDDGSEVAYELKIENSVVKKETLHIDQDRRLYREPDGSGKIKSKDHGMITFKVSPSKPAAIAKRDEFQHGFLEPLHEWANCLRYYPFSSRMGRDKVLVKTEDASTANPRDFSDVVRIFRTGTDQYGEKMTSMVRDDMKRIGYSLSTVGVETLRDMRASPIPATILGVVAKERDLKGSTPQQSMSDGMFRALSLIIHIAFAELSGEASCVVVDDIGEGLDFERSRKLIELLVERARKNKFQLIMATNDRFVMNAVPLESWTCLRRTGGKVEILNHINAKNLFDEFKLTGLSNFDFLTTGYFSESDEDA